MSSFSFAVTTREVVGKQARQLRTQGLIPAVMYGHKKESVSLAVDRKSFVKLLEDAGTSTLIDLVVDDKRPVKVLIHDVQLKPTNHQPVHVDFYVVNLKEKLQTAIALNFIGTAPAVEVEGGTLITVKDEINVECLPEDLVSELEIDISSLATFDDVIRVADIKLPKGMVALDDVEETVVSIAEPISQEELDALDEVVEDKAAEVESETKSGTEAPVEEDEKK